RGGTAFAKRRLVANGRPLKARTPFCSTPITGPFVVETAFVSMSSLPSATLSSEIGDLDRVCFTRGRRGSSRYHAAGGDEDRDGNPARRAFADQALADHRREAGGE